MQKVTENKIQKYGLRGIAISLPRVFASDNNLGKGDEVEIYRDQINGVDALIIMAKKPRVKRKAS